LLVWFVPLLDTLGVTQHSSRFSPDGKWIAYTSIETGRFEVFVQPFPRTGAKFRVTQQGGGHALWSNDGKELLFDNNRQLFAVSVRTKGSFFSGTPCAVADPRIHSGQRAAAIRPDAGWQAVPDDVSLGSRA